MSLRVSGDPVGVREGVARIYTPRSVSIGVLSPLHQVVFFLAILVIVTHPRADSPELWVLLLGTSQSVVVDVRAAVTGTQGPEHAVDGTVGDAAVPRPRCLLAAAANPSNQQQPNHKS